MKVPMCLCLRQALVKHNPSAKTTRTVTYRQLKYWKRWTLYPCSTKTREVFENPSSPPSRFPSAVGFAPHPQTSGFPSDFALGKSLGSQGTKPTALGKSLKISLDPRDFRQEIVRRGWISQYPPRLDGARIHCVLHNLTS